MQWEQILALLFGNLAIILPLWLWNRAEARADARKSDADNKELRRDLIDVMRSMDQQVNAIHQEIKDFHGRLCAIEERNRGR
jgi:hypothetical protein